MHLFPISRIHIACLGLIAVPRVRALVVDLDYHRGAEFEIVDGEFIGLGLQVPALAAAGTDAVDDGLVVGVGYVVGGSVAGAVDAGGGGTAGDGGAADLVPREGGGKDGVGV